MTTLLEYLLSDEDEGITALSLVLNPANKSQAVFMSESEDVFMTPTEDRVVKGIFVKAGQVIKQKLGGGAPSTFSEETIVKMRDKFHRSGADKRITINHEKEGGKAVLQDDCYVNESHIVKNIHDIESLYSQGIEDAEIGDWVVGVKVSEDVWENDVKTGEIDGLSLEGLFSSRTVAMSEYDKAYQKTEQLMNELYKDLN